MNLTEKVAIVTGGANGIGEAICKRMAQEGANVVVADIAIEQAKKLSDKLANSYSRSLALKVDVTKSQDANYMLTAVLDEFGKVDILVNNAGRGSQDKGVFSESEEDVWDFVIALNLKGVLNCTHAVINHMIERKEGKIVNIASRAGVQGTVGLADYSAAKAGVIGFTKALAKEIAPYGITVNSVSPGPIATSLFLSNPEEFQERIRSGVLLGRLGKPEEIASMAVFLASDEADFITGQNFIVDGGKA
jgi:2-hydroxycyclohexanecarboxyl-CoA dehydrogenase